MAWFETLNQFQPLQPQTHEPTILGAPGPGGGVFHQGALSARQNTWLHVHYTATVNAPLVCRRTTQSQKLIWSFQNCSFGRLPLPYWSMGQ